MQCRRPRKWRAEITSEDLRRVDDQTVFRSEALRTARLFPARNTESDSRSHRRQMNGSHCIHGFKNKDIRENLTDTQLKQFIEPKKASAKVSRILNRFHTHGLIAKIPRSRKWKVTVRGYRLMSTSLKIRKIEFPAQGKLAA